MNRIFIEILNMSISGSIMILAVLFVRLLLKKAPRWIPVLLFGLVAVRLILPFSIETSFSLIPSGRTLSLTSDSEKSDDSSGVHAQLTVDSGITAVDEYLNQHLVSEKTELVPSVLPESAEELKTNRNPGVRFLSAGSMIWLCGAVGIILYSLIWYMKLRRSVAEAVLYRENIYLCDQVQTPFILGFFRPRIYLPSGLSSPDTLHVLAHERAHLQRKDQLWKGLGFLLLAVYWFNPLMWLSYILFCRDIEAACDEKVVAGLQAPERKAYANALVSCSMNRQQVLAYPLAFGEINVKSRVKKVLQYNKPAALTVIIALIACAFLAGCFLTNPKEKDSHSDERRAQAVTALSEMYGTEPAEKLAQDIRTDRYQYQGAYAAYRVESVLSDEHLYYLLISEEPNSPLTGSLTGLRLAVDGKGISFLNARLDTLQYKDEEGRNWYLVTSHCIEREESSYVMLQKGVFSGTVDSDSYLEVKFSPMKTLHAEGNDVYRNIALSPMSLWVEDFSISMEDNTLRDVWPAHDLYIRMKDDTLIGGTREELENRTAESAASWFGTEMTYQNSSYLWVMFPELFNIDQAEAVIIDGEEFPLK